MSNIALILGANPKKSVGGPRIKLEAGTWRLVMQGVEQSTFSIASTSFDDPNLINLRPANDNMLLSPGYHKVYFVDRGEEKIISIYAIPHSHTE